MRVATGRRIVIWAYLLTMVVGPRAVAQGTRSEDEAKMGETNKKRIGLVDFGADSDAPQAPPIGIAISLGSGPPPKRFSANQPIVLHGSYNADVKMIRACRNGIPESILLTIVRTDRPWGETAKLVNPQSVINKPTVPDDANYGDNFREGGQFKLDLANFFDLPKEPGQYQIEAVLTSYHSVRIDFEIQ